jgi:hypothetical protein
MLGHREDGRDTNASSDEYVLIGGHKSKIISRLGYDELPANVHLFENVS